MKIIAFCFLFTVGLLLVDGRALDADRNSRYEIEGEQQHVEREPSFEDITSRLDVYGLKQKAKEQFENIKEIAKIFGIDVNQLKKKAEEKLNEWKEMAKEMGIDIEGLKSKFREQMDKLEEKAKEHGIDIDQIRAKAEAQIEKLKEQARGISTDNILKLAADIYSKINDEVTKAIEESRRSEEESTFEKLKRRFFGLFGK